MPEIKEKIYKRQILDEIIKYLFEKEAIILYGARQVGKTFILHWLEQYLLSREEQVYYIDLEARQYLQQLNEGVDNLESLLREQGFDLDKRIFVLIDEIQYLAAPTNFLKLISDHYRNLKLVVSGSSTFELRKKLQPTLVGRALTFEVFGLSFPEFLLFKNYPKPLRPAVTELKIAELQRLFTEFTLFGSYPKIALLTDKSKKEKYLWQIINTYLKKDIRDLAEVKEIDKFNKMLEVLAAQTGQLLNVEELANTTQLSKQTVQHYLFIMEQTYVIRLLKPFHKNLRSELFKTPKVYFYDSGLAHLLWLKVFASEVLGEIFETAVFAELVKAYDKDWLNYWRTKDKKEIDFILTKNNSPLPIEVKFNLKQFKPTAINYFLKTYNPEHYLIVGLEGQPVDKHCHYPWELGLKKSSRPIRFATPSVNKH